MKSIRTSIWVIFLAVGITASVMTITIQPASAPRDCGQCTAFKKLTHEFEKDVINAATKGDPNIIPSLLEQYSQDVLKTFELTPRG